MPEGCRHRFRTQMKARNCISKSVNLELNMNSQQVVGVGATIK
jgi:hypothetical protein